MRQAGAGIAQERQEGTDGVQQGAEEEINRLRETLTATSHEMQQIKEDFADRAVKLQYAEKLLDKAKTDFRDKNNRIKALEAHLAESRNEISRLTRQLDYVTEESESFQEELQQAYELRHEPSRTELAPTAPLPSRTKSPVPGLTREHKRIHQRRLKSFISRQNQNNLLQPAADRRTAWT